MAYEYKRNRNKGASEITSPKFTYTRDLQKRKEYEKQQADYERRLLEEQKKFEEQHKNATSYNAWKEKTLGKTVDAEALWNSAIDISQKNNIIDRNTPTQADTSVLEEIEQLASQRKNVLNPFGTESIEDKLKKKTVTEDVEQLPEALKVALDKGYSNNLDPLKSKNAVTETKPRGEFDAGKQQVSQQLLTAIKTAKKKTENKYRLYNGVLYDLEELRREGKTISVIADDQKEYDQAVKDYAELEAYYNQITAESGLPLELEEKYKKYIGGNQTDTYEFIRKLQSSEQMANDVGSDITRGILNPQYSRDDFGDAWGYLFDTSSSEYNSVYMNTNERYAYFNILKNEGVEAADAFYAKLEPYLLSRRNVDTERQANEVVQEANGLERTIMTLTEALSVVLAPIDYGLKAYGELTDQSFGLNHGLSVLEMQTNAISEDIAQDSKFWSWMYGLGLSAGKSVVSLASGAPTLLMGADAASSTIDAAKKRGLSKEQTLLYGTLLGLTEGFTEQIGIDALFGDATNLLKYLFTNIAAEGLEEGLSNVLGTVADVAVNKDEAEIIVSYENYIKEGFSDEEAKRKALLDFVAELALDTLGGGITGGFFAGGGIGGHIFSNAIGNKLNTSKAISLDGRTLSKGENAQADIQTLIDNANKSGDKKLQKAANKVAKTEKDGSYTASDKKLGKLVRLSEENRQQLIIDSVKYDNATKTDAIKKLEEGGFDTETAEKTFETLMRDIAKGQVSTELAQAMGKNKAIRPLYESLSDYYSEEAITERMKSAQEASPVTEISNRIVDQRLKDAGIDVVDESGDIDNIDSVVNVDEFGNYILKRKSGETVTYDPSSYNLPNVDAPNADKVSFATELFGLNGAQTYVKLAPDNATSQYKADFTSIYNQGATGKAFSQIETDISPEAQKAIYEAGKADRDTAIERRQNAETEAKEKEATFVKKQMGFKSDRVTLSEEAVAKIKSVSDKGISDQYKAAVKVIDGLAKMLQVNINIVASETDADGKYIGANGMYNRATNTFTFDIMSGMDNVADISYSAMIKTAGHELTHFIQNWSPSKYLTLKNTTLKFLTEEHSEQWINEQLKVIQRDNKAIGKNLTLEQAKDELVADAFEDVLSNIDFAETILRTDKTLFDKIHSWVKKNVNDFKKNLGIAVKDVEAISDAAKEMRKAGERAQALYDQWAEAFSTALENSTSQQMDVDGDVQNLARKKYWYPNMSVNELSYVKRLAKHEVITTDNYIDSDTKWLYNTKNGNVYFALYSTAEANDPTILYACKGARAQFEHDFLKEYISEGANLNGDIDSRTKIVNAILKNHRNVNRSGSIHSRNTVGRGSNNGNAGVHSQNERRRPSNAFLDSLRNIEEIQLNNERNGIKPDPDTQAQARRVTKEQDTTYMDAVKRGDKETAQRMVDEVAEANGYTIDAYHGTPNADFTVFDKERVGKGIDQYGAGFYFATNREAASRYGRRVIDARLSIKKPLKIDASTENGANLIDGGYDHLLTVNQAYKVIKQLPNIYDPEESILGDYYDSYWEEGAQDWMIRDLASNESYRNIGYLDSDLFRNYPNELHEALRDVVGYDGVEVTFGNGDKFYVAWFNNQMKSADPITYDDNGSVIPLSERFNPENEDIRYSARNISRTKDIRLKKAKATIARDFVESMPDSPQKAKLKVLANNYAKQIKTFEKEQRIYIEATANGNEEIATVAYAGMTLAEVAINQIETDVDFASMLNENATREKLREQYNREGKLQEEIRAFEADLTDAQREVRESKRLAEQFAEREKQATYRAKQIELRNQRDRNTSLLLKEKTRLKSALEKPTETASVPKGAKPIADKVINLVNALNVFNGSSAITRPSAELIDLIAQMVDGAKKLADGSRSKALQQRVDSIDKMMRNAMYSVAQVKEQLVALEAEYKKLSPDDEVRGALAKAPSAAESIIYDKSLHDGLKVLIVYFSEPHIVLESGMFFVKEGLKMVRAMNHQLLKANQMYVKGKSVEVLKLRNMLLQDVKMASPFLNKFLGNAMVSNVLMPKTMLHIVFGATENADIFYDMFDDGQMRYIRFMNGAREIFSPVEKEIENESFKSDKPTLKTGLKYMDGTDVLLNYEFALSFIKIVENEDSLRHAVWGGLQIPDLVPYNKGDKSAYNSKRLVEHAQPEYAPAAMSDEDIDRKLRDAAREGKELTNEEYTDMYAQQIVWNNRVNLAAEIEAKYKKAAEMLKKQMNETPIGKQALKMFSAMTEYYDVYAKKHLNEATMELYGFEKTLQEGKTYYPIRVRKDEKASDDNVDIIRDFSLENWGSMKHRVDSKKGIELYGALTELESYMENTAKFYAWTTVTKNMKKILNTQIIDDNGTVTTLVGKVNQLYGSYDPEAKGVKKVKNKFMSGFEKYMKDLQTEIIGANKGGEKWAKLQGAFVTNALLMNISTPLVQYSATPLVAVDSGYLSFIKTVAKGGKIPALLSEAQKQYVAKYSEVYRYRSSGLINVDLAAAKQNKGVVSKALSSKALAWTESADAQVLGKQFYALLDHVKRTHKGISAEEAARIAGKQLDQTIYEFQANYTVLQRAPVLRGSGIKKLLFGTFRTQQITLLNAMIDSSVRSHTLSEQMKQVKKDSPEYKALERKRSDSKKRTAKIHLAIALSNALNAFIRMGVGFIRRKDDDEKGETAFIDFLDSYLSMIPLFGDIASAIVSIASGRMFYGEKVFSLGMLDTLSDSVTSAAEIAGMLFDDEDQELSEYIKELTNVLAVSGVPARNIYNIIKMIMGWAEDAADAAGWDWDLDVDEW